MSFRSLLEPLYEQRVIHQCKYIPKHVALILDGNRRFARMMGFATTLGHRAGADRIEEMLEWAHDLGIRYLTLYTFSTENFKRSEEEVRDLFDLFKERLNRIREDDRVFRFGIRIQIIGDRELLPCDLIDLINEVETATAHHDNFFLNVALAYGGRNEILQASRKILRDVREKRITKDDITPQLLEENLYGKASIPPVDLIIRTGDECRTSNFLPWLANGHESAVYFCAPFWPMFRKLDLLRATRLYSRRIELSRG
ncbi:MAG: di-trans,poly-cis-decaprenylcistransferase [Methanospirillaceae archaeon]|nr:di-trans,poly-cis-decaprenylcistransferase [Methanospirillaceae archaeon]